MPTYNYICKSCEYTFEMFLSVENRRKPEETSCPNCGKRKSIVKEISEVSRPVIHWEK